VSSALASGPGDGSNPQLAQLPIVNRRRRPGHQIHGLRGFRKCDDLTNRRLTTHERHDAIEAERNAAMRWRAVLEGVQEEAESRPGVLVRDPEQPEDVPLHVGPMNPDAAAGDFGAVQRQVVGARAHTIGRRLEERYILGPGRGERMVHRIPALLVRVVLEQRETRDPEKLEVVRLEQTRCLGDLQAQATQHVCHLRSGASHEEQEVAACTWVRVGELGKIIRTLKQAGCARAVMAGGIKKVRLFSGFRPDLRGAAFLARMRTLHDDKLLTGIAGELAGEGIEIVESTRYLPDLLPQPGVLTRRAPRRREQDDIRFGFEVAKAVGAFEIGQTVVVKDGLVVAVEAVEGTDAAIRRGGELARGGAVVVKVSKPGQDLRFDVPAVGMTTIEVMREVGACVLALEAGRTIMIDREELVRAADAAGIAIVAVE